jgi:hydroxyacylglutathione hydrolase
LNKLVIGDLDIYWITDRLMHENCYVLTKDSSNQAIVIDPGFQTTELLEHIRERKMEVVALAATHGHCDHIASAGVIQEIFPAAPLYIHQADRDLLERANLYSVILKAPAVKIPVNIVNFSDHAPKEFSPFQLRVHNVPGHTPGSVLFAVEGAVFSGDIFLQSQNERMPGFSAEHLRQTHAYVKQSFKLSDFVFPGHGRPIRLEETLARLAHD